MRTTRFNVFDAIRVTLSNKTHLDCIVTDVQTPEQRRANSRVKDDWPWPDRTKLTVVYLDEVGWRQTWYHDDDDEGVQLHPDADQVLAQWSAHILLHGEEPSVWTAARR